MSARKTNLYLNREISWLEFNGRVLEEAQDTRNPLLERVRFYCIFRSNLDEFFMVRVASLQHLIEQGDNNPDPSGLTPREQLDAILTRARTIYDISGKLFCSELLPALEKENIFLRTPDRIKPEQEKFLDEYFETEIFPVLTPVAIDDLHPFPHLPALVFNLAVLLEPREDRSEEPRLARRSGAGPLAGIAPAARQRHARTVLAERCGPAPSAEPLYRLSRSRTCGLPAYTRFRTRNG